MKLSAASLLALLGGAAVDASPEREPMAVSKPTCAKPAKSGSCHAAGLVNAKDEAVVLAPEQPEDPESVRVVIKQNFFEGQDVDFAGLVIPSVYTNGEPVCIEHFGPVTFGSNLYTAEGQAMDIMCDPLTNTAKIAIYISDHRLDGEKLEDLAEDFDGRFPDECDLGEFVPTEMCTVTYEIKCGCSEDSAEEEVEIDADADSDSNDVDEDTEPAEIDTNVQRKLDAQLRPTPAPTGSPTAPPKKTNAPSVSFEPTTSVAPTGEQGPGCDGITHLPDGYIDKLPFCYDGSNYDGVYRGRGRGRGKAATTCYVVNESECGLVDFMIEGANSMDNYRTSDVFDWYQHCVTSYECAPEHDNNVDFTYGAPNVRKVSWINSKGDVPGYYRFTLDGNGVSGGAYKWKCPTKEAAHGMKHFTDAVYNTKILGDGRRLFETPVGTCESAAPSESMVPTSSPAPSLPVAPDCTKDLGYHFPYAKPRTSNHAKRSSDGPSGKTTVVVNKHCQYYLYGGGVQGNKYVNNAEELVEAFAEAWGATLIDNGAKFDPLARMDKEKIGYAFCTDEPWCKKDWWYAKFEQHEGVLHADKIFLFESRTYVSRFRRLFFEIAKNDNEVFNTYDENNKCGISPMCVDDGSTACFADTKQSDFCGPFDFVVMDVNSDEQLRTNDVWEFFTDCATSWPSCTRHDVRTPKFVYGKSPKVHTWRSGDTRVIRLKGNGFEGEVQYRCANNEQGLDLYNFGHQMWVTDLFKKKKSECTESPTDSPTACQDGFLTKPPVNINIVIDISYSSYLTQFGGSHIGDLNGDGKANTILDAEIGAVLQLLKVIENSDVLDNDNVDLGVVVFETSGFYKGDYMPAGRYKPLNSNGDGVNPELLKDLRGIQTLKTNATVIYQNKGFTNFDDALDKSIDYFIERENDPTINFDEWTNLMVFLSDGVPNIRGDGDEEPFCDHGIRNLNCNNRRARNKADTDDTLPWESGELSFCMSGDGDCWDNKYKPCVLGSTCEGDRSVKMFQSEFDRLDKFGPEGVKRISIGVGKASDNSIGSGLYLIDNNPLKKTFPDLLPPVVTTTDALANLLRNLCYENTANPTDLPSSSPTLVPSSTPTNYPTHMPTTTPTSGPTTAPTSIPTFGPTSAPTSNPTEMPSDQPTDDLCEYTVLDFEGEGGMALPETWSNTYGMRIMSMTSDGAGNLAYVETDDVEAGVALAVPNPNSVVDEMNPEGGSIMINQDLTQDKHMRLSLFGADQEFKIIRRSRETTASGEVISTVVSVDEYDAFSGVKEFKVAVDGIFQIEIQFEGRGSLSKLQICRNPNSTPAPYGLATNGSTDTPTTTPTSSTTSPTSMPTSEPTAQAEEATSGPTSGPTSAPTSAPTAHADEPTSGPTSAPTTNSVEETSEPTVGEDDSECPSGATVYNSKGNTQFLENPIDVVSYDGTTVTFKVKQTWTETVGYVYTDYQKSLFDSECVLLEDVDWNAGEIFTATCMESINAAVVDIFVSDPSFDSVLDDAEIPQCCQKPADANYPTIQYTFEIKCNDPCPAAARKLATEANKGDEVTGGYAKKTVSEHAIEAKTDATNNTVNDHYCKPSEHPCGDNPNMVNMCHYSSKNGYQTFCVAAADSDIVAYYPNDSCGRCPPELVEKKAAVDGAVTK